MRGAAGHSRSKRARRSSKGEDGLIEDGLIEDELIEDGLTIAQQFAYQDRVRETSLRMHRPLRDAHAGYLTS